MISPRATLRLQLHAGYTLHDAARDLPYFARLGVSHLYLSPVSRACPGSNHGYDVVDHMRVDEERGGEDALRELSARARDAGMGILLDIVPNHMATHPDNAWGWDVLTHGRASAYAQWFDIDWESSILRGKLLAPFLDKPYPDALRAGDIRLSHDAERGLHVTAHGVPWPIAPGSLPTDTSVEELLRAHAPDDEQGRQQLHDLLERQHYCLAWWHRAADLINWRRFFEVSGLIGVTVERDDVFRAVHELPLRLYAEGVVDGLRIDHVDGLAQPLDYCRRLREAMKQARAEGGGRQDGTEPWIVVEKILAPGETLDDRWAVDGTTGYDFAADVGALLHDGDGLSALAGAWARVSGDDRPPEAWLREARQELLDRHFVAERETLFQLLRAAAQQDAEARDWATRELSAVLDALLCCFPTYRSYVEDAARAETDQAWFDRALRCAQERLEGEPGPAASSVQSKQVRAERHAAMLRWLDRKLGGEAPGTDAARTIVRRFQQLTPPLAAKALEDTVFYRYGSLLSRNEVGSDPSVFAATVEEFHASNLQRTRLQPLGLLATATHDHKRGEDVRARLAVLSEIPEAWWRRCCKWMEEGHAVTDTVPTDVRYMLMQTLVGAWPPGLRADDEEGVSAFVERVGDWLVKALREGKRHSSWFEPDTATEEACLAYLHELAAGGDPGVFGDIEAFVKHIEPGAIVNGLVQTALRMTSPGVPDLYQGTELRDFSLVDPDNRRPVDYGLRRRYLESLHERSNGAGVGPPLESARWDAAAWDEGGVKQALIATLLQLRHEKAEAFAGDYRPLAVAGGCPQRLVAFSRNDEVVVVAGVKCGAHVQETADGAPRLPGELWGDATLQLPAGEGSWREILHGRPLRASQGPLRLADLLDGVPLAVFCRQG